MLSVFFEPIPNVMEQATKIKKPKISIIKDYDDTFRNRVRTAIKYNQDNQVEMVDAISIDSGSYRSYCMAFDVTSSKDYQHCALDFYAANRRFGFEHTIKDIAKAIKRK